MIFQSFRVKLILSFLVLNTSLRAMEKESELLENAENRQVLVGSIQREETEQNLSRKNNIFQKSFYKIYSYFIPKKFNPLKSDTIKNRGINNLLNKNEFQDDKFRYLPLELKILIFENMKISFLDSLNLRTISKNFLNIIDQIFHINNFKIVFSKKDLLGCLSKEDFQEAVLLERKYKDKFHLCLEQFDALNITSYWTKFYTFKNFLYTVISLKKSQDLSFIFNICKKFEISYYENVKTLYSSCTDYENITDLKAVICFLEKHKMTKKSHTVNFISSLRTTQVSKALDYFEKNPNQLKIFSTPIIIDF